MDEPTQSLRGQFLLDGGNLAGSWFQRTVVLICQHDAEGAFGLVLNRPAGTRVGDALEGDLPESLKQMPLLLGGPVQPGALSYLRTDVFLPDASVMPNIELGHSLEELVELATGFSAGRSLKVFAGYAGWSPGQLDSEMAREAWIVHPASVDLVFDESPDTLWRRILRAKGGLFRLLADAPEDPLTN
ncbi:MAG: YqgE/AlgH family protein [Limisphaerales bacterium]